MSFQTNCHCAALLALAVCCCRIVARAAERATLPTNGIAKPMEIPGVHNAFRVTDKIYSGSQPEGEKAFAALAKLGVKTIVSVDGSVPDVEAARKFSMQYVHLPFGYDGIPNNRVAQIAKLTTELSGRFFVHCHHGLHRGPAAVAVMCEASAGWTPAQAEAWMHVAGTAMDYSGLYLAAREFKTPTRAEFEAIKQFPEITKPSSFVEAMVAIEESFSLLRLSHKAGWKAPPGHADISPAHEATILGEHFRELARTDAAKQRSEDFRKELADAERAAHSLSKRFRENSDSIALDASFQQVGQSCTACHKEYRNK